MLVNLGACKNKEDLEKIQRYQPTIAKETLPPRETVKIKNCTIYFKDNDNLEIKKLINIDFSDKDFILFTEYGGNISIYRRDAILEIHIDERGKKC